MNWFPDEDDCVEDEVGDGEVLGAVLHREGAGAAAEVVQPDAHLGMSHMEPPLFSFYIPWKGELTLEGWLT